ncbi:MAG TPA: aminotransferase class I/II-fold pyridoxal phosphate-dependent enzyme [Candidatus Acidoferrales bacterium]|nr:aminotransferase class I/II-fold pyridoxal phosphate-dependent enzyme [Candidatus Acidoferrales bacterium]
MAFGLDDPRVVVLGTLSKALGVHGGFVAGPAEVVELLVNRARTFVFDTALPPALAEAARRSVQLVRGAGDRRARLRENVERLRGGLPSTGFAGAGSEVSPIVPLVIGSEAAALSLSRHLLDAGIVAPAIRPPTVPEATSRLRFSIRSSHRTEQLDRLIEALKRCTVTL